MAKPIKYKSLLDIDGLNIPTEIIVEHRRDTRFSITGKRLLLRLPTGASNEYVQKQLRDFQIWVGEQFKAKPALREPFKLREYQTGDVLTVGTRRYILEVLYEDRSTHTAKLLGNTIELLLSDRSAPEQRHRSIKTLLSRVVAGDYYPEIMGRVLEWNAKSVQQTINNVYLKYNHTNWGSCSSHGNVNLSTRLLFAPVEVQDYVILHELAHLVELNHSDRFWAIVEKHMPDYLEKEQWLKKNRSLCDF